MKTNILGIVITCIITFNIFCLIAYFVLKAISASRINDEYLKNDASEDESDAEPPKIQ